MKIIRYSINGFKSQKQTHHMNTYIKPNLEPFNENLFPNHLKDICRKLYLQHKEFYEKHLNDLEEGIWVFIDGHKNNQSLNHLKHNVPCWSAEIDDSAEVYEVNLWNIINITDPLCEDFGCFIPKRELYKIKNIRKIKKNAY